jgi:hypothetical protein
MPLDDVTCECYSALTLTTPSAGDLETTEWAVRLKYADEHICCGVKQRTFLLFCLGA